ncbi:kinase-like domain-containing protein [Mycena pura]|uniref:Kinase-like domain-containing protein n=1 Tax=Mycena pura TaxID=153505 RepID=A0AAD6V4I5_9AGAR|nr:kinase-like domain-containing protein [Mycena pura]
MSVNQCLSLGPDTAAMNCNLTFPLKNTPGLCAGCTILATLSGEALKRTQGYLQCISCGTRYRGLQVDGGLVCAVCAKIEGIAPLPSSAAQLEEQRRIDKMGNINLQKLKARQAATGAIVPSSTPATILPKKVTIAVDAYIGGGTGKAKAQSAIGTLPLEFELDDSMFGMIIPHFLQSINPTWELRQENPLEIDDVQIRFLHNTGLQCDFDWTLRDFVQANNNNVFAKECPATFKAAAKKIGVFPAFIYLELHVQSDLYQKRTHEPIQLSGPGKRKFTGNDDRKSKRTQLSNVARPAPMVSSFRPPAEYTAPASRTQVALSKLAFTVADDGTVEFDELSSEDVASPTYIHDEKLGKGTMKIVFKVDTPSATYVAKRFYRASADASSGVSVEKNRDLLLDEMVLLGQTGYFLQNFYERGKEFDVDLDNSLMVSEAWLATETITEEGNACPAAGIEEDDYDTARTSGITWLLEPFRGGPVKKHCGTLLRNTMFSPGRLAATINAFIHFTYLYSQKSMVLSMKVKIGGKEKNIIFDPMTHTPNGATGPGDHGKDGIEDFVQNHKCNQKCMALGLESLAEEESDGE